MTKSRNILGPRRIWSEAELTILREQYPHERSADIAERLGIDVARVTKRAAILGIKKSAAFAASDKSGRISKGQHIGQGTQFLPGQKPWNTGTHYVAGGRSAEMCFKKGQMSGAAQHNWVPIGTYRINSDGVLDQKITDDWPPHKHWEAVHRLVWKAANGPIPAGHVITFKPGRKTTVLELITPDAVECVSRAEMTRRNSYWIKNPELGRLYQLKSRITQQVNRIQKEVS